MKKGLDNYMKRLPFVLILSFALMFAACGDSGEATSGTQKAGNDSEGSIPSSSWSNSESGSNNAFNSCEGCGSSSSLVAVPVGKSSSSVISGTSSVKSSSSQSDAVVDGPRKTVGSMTDSRDGRSYKTVKIGSQTWMAQNLNFETEDSYCYNDNVSNCDKYGRLYMWSAAMDSAGKWSLTGKGCGYGLVCSPTYPVRGVCPSGWHLPTMAEFETLFAAVGGDSIAGKMLKSTYGWNQYDTRRYMAAYRYVSGDGTDDYSFTAFPAGAVYTYGGAKYVAVGEDACFWSSMEDDQGNRDYAKFVMMKHGRDSVILNRYYKYIGYSVRCVMDDASSSPVFLSSSSTVPASSSATPPLRSVTMGFVTDSRDEQACKTVVIGSRTWMAQI